MSRELIHIDYTSYKEFIDNKMFVVNVRLINSVKNPEKLIKRPKSVVNIISLLNALHCIKLIYW